MLNATGKVRCNRDFIFYNQLVSPCGSVRHMGDNLVGGEGCNDDEVIQIDLENIPADVSRLVFTVTIHEAKNRGENFGMIASAFIRIVDQSANKEIARFDLSENASACTSMIFGEIYKRGNDWKFKAIGQGYEYGLMELARQYGARF